VVWACAKVEENAVKAKLGDLLALAGLGLAIGLSIALTAGGTAATDALVRVVGLDGVPGMGTLTRLLGLGLAVAADTLVFTWLFVRLPRRPVRIKTVLRGAVFTAVGYEILKVVGTFYLSRVGANGAYGAFAGVVGLLIWIDLVSRFLLVGAAWTATTGAMPAEATARDDPPSSATLADEGAGGTDAGVGGSGDRPGAADAGVGGSGDRPGAAAQGAGRGAENERGRPAASVGDRPDGPDRREPAGSSAQAPPGPPASGRRAGVLVGTGAALGVAATAAATRRLLRRRDDT